MTENKGDLISREALKKAIEQGEGISWDSYGKDDLCVRKKYIDNAPTVEPEAKVVANVSFNKEQMEELVEKAKADILAQIERPQGEWIITKDEKFYHYKCPFCSFWATGDFLRTYNNLDLPNFCEKCGADLRGEEE